MNALHRTAALAAAAALLVAACGSDDPVADPEDAAAAQPAEVPADEPADATAGEPADDGGSDSALPSGGPDATIAPDVPEEFLPGIGPVEVVGDTLPFLETPDIAADPAIGSAAPVLIGEAFDGSTVRVDATAAGPTMIVFLAHWCPHCNDEIPIINGLRDDGALDGINVVAVATASNPGRPNWPPAAWLDDVDWTFPAMADGVNTVDEVYIASDAFGVSAFPFVALVNDDGTLAARWSGGRSADDFVRLIDAYLDV